MKNSIQLNIGTRTPAGELTVPEVATALRRAGFVLTHSRTKESLYNGVPETCLAVEALCALPLCHVECKHAVAVTIARLAKDLRQECIAVRWPDGGAELIPNVGAFDAQWWVDPREVETLPAPENTPACDCVANAIDACKHNAQVARDNGDTYCARKYDTCGAFLQSRADNLRAVICPAPTPDRRFFECVAHDLGNIRDRAEDIGNAQACIIKEIDSLLEIIHPLADTVARNPEITSGW